MKEQPIKKAWWRDGVVVFTKASAWIVAPLLAAIFIGKTLDREFDTKPWLFLTMVAVAFFISCVGIVRTMKKEVAKMKKGDNGEDKNGN